MKKFWLFLAMAVMIIMVSCSKDEDNIPPDPPPPITDNMSLIIKTDFAEGMSASNIELCLSYGANQEIRLVIKPVLDTVLFSGQRATDLLDKQITASLTITDPKLNGQTCNLIYLSDESLTFTGAVSNVLNWDLSFDPATTAPVMFIINIIYPEGVTFDVLGFRTGAAELELGDALSPGVDTLYFAELAPYIGENAWANIFFTAIKNGEYCSLVPNPDYAVFFTLAAVNHLTWTLVQP